MWWGESRNSDLLWHKTVYLQNTDTNEWKSHLAGWSCSGNKYVPFSSLVFTLERLWITSTREEVETQLKSPRKKFQQKSFSVLKILSRRFCEAARLESVLLKSLSGSNMDCFHRAYSAWGPGGLPSPPQMRVTVIRGAAAGTVYCCYCFPTWEYNMRENTVGTPPGTLNSFFDHSLDALISVAFPCAFALFPRSKKGGRGGKKAMTTKKKNLVLKMQKIFRYPSKHSHVHVMLCNTFSH